MIDRIIWALLGLAALATLALAGSVLAGAATAGNSVPKAAHTGSAVDPDRGGSRIARVRDTARPQRVGEDESDTEEASENVAALEAEMTGPNGARTKVRVGAQHDVDLVDRDDEGGRAGDEHAAGE